MRRDCKCGGWRSLVRDAPEYFEFRCGACLHTSRQRKRGKSKRGELLAEIRELERLIRERITAA